jgi:hypothetical protein
VQEKNSKKNGNRESAVGNARPKLKVAGLFSGKNNA